MRQYVVYRHGWNEANQNPAQGLPEKMCVARVEADSPEEACRLALRQVSLQGGQRLSAEPADEVDAREEALNLKGEALERPENFADEEAP
jgi:hypothetical protein